ncbi:ATP-binding protein [Streptomyces sp. NPDC001514]
MTASSRVRRLMASAAAAGLLAGGSTGFLRPPAQAARPSGNTATTAPTAPTARLVRTARCPLGELAISLPPGHEAPGLARRRVAGFLDGLRPALAPGHRDDILLIVSELVTNAVVHAPGPYALALTADADAGTVDVAVDDGSTTVPVPRRPDVTGGTGGRGLRIAEDLGARLFTEPVPGGKRVHATIAPPCRPGMRPVRFGGGMDD